MNTGRNIAAWTLLSAFVLLAGCRTAHELIETGELERADISAVELVEQVPDYSQQLLTLSGNGRALISEPGNSDRVSVNFHSDRQASLMTIRNRLGIEGGQLLVKEDSVLVYNRVDKTAEKIPLSDAGLSEAGRLATMNLIDLFHYPAARVKIGDLFQDNSYYVAATVDGKRITIDKENGFVRDVQAPPGAAVPYSRISYDGYTELNDFYLPRKITIFSQDGNTRVTLLIRQLQANQVIPPLEIDIPDEIPY